jgi:L,D-transpeptidase ErfK/SrfK
MNRRSSMSQNHPTVDRSQWIMFLCFGIGGTVLLTQLDHYLQAWRSSPPVTHPASAPPLESANSLLLQTISTQAVQQAFPQQQTRLVVRLGDRRVYVYQDDQVVQDYPIAVGQAGWETPLGDFSVIHMQENPIWRHPITGEWIPPGDANPLGTHWVGFWSDGLHQIGFHGTNQEDLIGQAVSHGCIRMHNADIQALYAYVSLGTLVKVEP